DGRQVVAAVGVGNDLGVGELLRVLLEAAVEVPDVRVDVDDPLAVDPGLQPEHAVGAGVLGPHTDVEVRARAVLLIGHHTDIGCLRWWAGGRHDPSPPKMVLAQERDALRSRSASTWIFRGGRRSM